jgi:hypothetical protein
MSKSVIECHNRFSICVACQLLIDKHHKAMERATTTITLDAAQQMLDLMDIEAAEPLYSFAEADDSDIYRHRA